MGTAVLFSAACARTALETRVGPWQDRILPFDRSPEDRPYLGTGLSGVAEVPGGTGYTQGVRIVGVRPDQALAIAGLRDGDVIVELAGQRLDGPPDALLQQLRSILSQLEPDSRTSLAYYRIDAGVRWVEFWLGRRLPPFAGLKTPPGWFDPVYLDRPLRDTELDAWIADAIALDGGAERLADTERRQREQLELRDTFRLREAVLVHAHPTAQERLLELLSERLERHPLATAAVAGGLDRLPVQPEPGTRPNATWDELLDTLEAFLVDRASWLRRHLADWTPEERAWLAKNFELLTKRVIVGGEYIYGDVQVERERANRRTINLLKRVDREGLARIAAEIWQFLGSRIPELKEFARKDGREGLLAARDTPAGRIEIWGGGDQRHKQRCLFRLEVGGDDNYLDTAGRADLSHPLSINVDLSGDDIYGATAPFSQGGALAGIGILIDEAGDDQYLGRRWCQGAAVAGVGLLLDRSGRDTYRGREACQGASFVGGATLADLGGDDTYSADRFSQGVGFPGGVGALLDRAGNDRYACTGAYGSEYGEEGVFSGWGQGVGFGFRGVASGGIGLLIDRAGDDVYEAGNFSQGGAYFFAWGALKDDSGDDRYIGSRYAQGFAAHQAAGTFVEGGGNDLYQSHSSVAQGLSWDESSVLFRDRGGNDRYETRGFSLASAAHNSIVVFIDDEGDDRYADLPAKAGSNDYHGGWSFALFVDRAGRDHYRGGTGEEWNGRAFWRHDGAYALDLDGDRPLEDLVREPRSGD